MKLNRREVEVQAGGLGFLARRGGCFFWRNNSGVFSPRPGSFVRAGIKGAADILCVLAPAGRLAGIECKREVGGRVSPAQKAWGEALEAVGGLYVVARSVDDVAKALGPRSS